MNLGLDENSYKLNSIISEEKLTSLKAISMVLDVCNQYSNIEDEQIQEIIENISQLINEINALSISDDLKEVVIHNLNSVNFMINNHKIYGVDGIKEAVEKGFGNIILNNKLSDLVKDDPKAHGILKNVLNLFVSINTIITFSKNIAPMLPEAIEVAKKFFII